MKHISEFLDISKYRSQEEHDREEAENKVLGFAGYDEYNRDEEI